MKMRLFIPWLAAVGVLAFAFCFRYAMAERSLVIAGKQIGSDFVPRTVEEGVIYRYIRALADGAAITVPAGSEAYSASAQMSLAMERFLAAGIKIRRLFCGPEPAGTAYSYPAEDGFMRVQLTLWISLIPLAVLWMLRSCRAPWLLAVGGAMLETVAAAACARYTGEVLVKGTFGFPLLALALGAQCAYFASPRRWLLVLLALLVFMACASWDAAQLFLGLWCASEALRLLFGGRPHRRNFKSFLALFSGMVLAAAVSPYCRLHLLILSPAVLAAAPLAFMLNLKKFTTSARWMLAVIVSGVWLSAASRGAFMGNYGHFTSLLWAKIRFLNVKPADPSLLTFDQRYLWTPQLNSVSWDEFTILFPAALWICAGVLVLLVFFRCRRNFKGARFAAMLAVYLFLSVLFYRFCVFSGLFISLALPLGLAAFYRKSAWWRRVLCVAVLAAAVGLEWRHNLRYTRSHSPLLAYQARLAECLSRYDFAGEPILANMDVGGIIYAHSNANILIQPKFELAPVRECTYEYTKLLFDPDPEKFVRWCDEHKIRFYLHAVGTADWPPLTPDGAPHIYSARYMAAVNSPAPTCVALRCDRGWTGMESLIMIPWPDRYRGLEGVYRLYMVVSADDRELAEFNAEAALDALADGDVENARRLASEAWLAAPCRATHDAFRKVYARFPLSAKPEFYFKSR